MELKIGKSIIWTEIKEDDWLKEVELAQEQLTEIEQDIEEDNYLYCELELSDFTY